MYLSHRDGQTYWRLETGAEGDILVLRRTHTCNSAPAHSDLVMWTCIGYSCACIGPVGLVGLDIWVAVKRLMNPFYVQQFTQICMTTLYSAIALFA